VDFAALPGLFEQIAFRAERAAVPAAGAIAKTYEKHLVDVTLTESGGHPPVTPTPSAPGQPPAIMTHRLRASVAMTGPVGGGGLGFAWVAPHTIYAATQEWGGVHVAKNGPYMWLWIHYIGWQGVMDRGWRKRVVYIPERSYMRRAVAEEIVNGELGRAAALTFEIVVWG
jgi:hypothetical protein